MSSFRELQIKLKKIEESYYKDLDIDIQELRLANKDLPADQLVRLARERFGQEAATYLSNQLEDEYDLADYNASDPQPHMTEDLHPEDPISKQVQSLLSQGKKVFSKISGAMGEVLYTEGRLLYINIRGSKNPAVTSFDSKDNVEIIGNIDHYDIVEHWGDNEIDEALGRVVEVPSELRGTDTDNAAGATSRDAERFLADLGPDDDVSHDVVDPETGELLDWPTKGLNRDDREDWRAQGGTKRERGMATYKANQERGGFNDVPILHLGADGAEFGEGQDIAWEFLNELRDSDFYNVVWRDVADDVEDPEMMRGNDYDIDVEIPVLLKRKDGAKLVDDDHDNIKEIIKAVKAASTLGNIGIGYAGTTDGGTTARFHAMFH